MKSSSRRWLLAGLSLCFLLRAGYAATRPATLSWPDEDTYVRVLAGNLAAGHGYTMNPENGPEVTEFPPAWPFLLAGLQALGLTSLLTARLLNVLIGTAGAYGVYRAGLEVGRFTAPGREEPLARIALFLYAVSPTLVYYAGTLLLETFFVTMIAWASWLALRWFAEPTLANSLWLGLELGLTALVKNIAYPLAWAFILIAAAAALGRKARWSTVAALLISIYIVWTPWLTRNYFICGSFTFTAQSGYTLYEANNPEADGGPRRPGLVYPMEEEIRRLPEVARNRAWRKAATDWIRANPDRFLALAVRKFGRLWNPVPNYAAFAASRFIWWVSLCWNLPLYALALIGMALGLKHRWNLLPLYLLPLYFTAIHCVFVASIRYREPVMPAAYLFAALALTAWIGHNQRSAAEAIERGMK